MDKIKVPRPRTDHGFVEWWEIVTIERGVTSMMVLSVNTPAGGDPEDKNWQARAFSGNEGAFIDIDPYTVDLRHKYGQVHPAGMVYGDGVGWHWPDGIDLRRTSCRCDCASAVDVEPTDDGQADDMATDAAADVARPKPAFDLTAKRAPRKSSK